MHWCCVLPCVELYILHSSKHEEGFGYREGWTAQQLFDQLIQDEFAQTGGLLPLNPRIKGGRDTPPHLTAELFARSVLFSLFFLHAVESPSLLVLQHACVDDRDLHAQCWRYCCNAIGGFLYCNVFVQLSETFSTSQQLCYDCTGG